ncbi:MAG: hypothetical protein JXA71_00130 [Chitinispirillaceae bacterium]|nr:hypothetical protein [Chitinispirillaceae bacterium]
MKKTGADRWSAPAPGKKIDQVNYQYHIFPRTILAPLDLMLIRYMPRAGQWQALLDVAAHFISGEFLSDSIGPIGCGVQPLLV